MLCRRGFAALHGFGNGPSHGLFAIQIFPGSDNVQKMPSGFSQVNVKMTLTAPGCGMGTVIAGDAQQKLLGLDAVEEANVEIVWDPPWHQSMITAEGRRILGLE